MVTGALMTGEWAQLSPRVLRSVAAESAGPQLPDVVQSRVRHGLRVRGGQHGGGDAVDACLVFVGDAIGHHGGDFPSLALFSLLLWGY